MTHKRSSRYQVTTEKDGSDKGYNAIQHNIKLTNLAARGTLADHVEMSWRNLVQFAKIPEFGHITADRLRLFKVKWSKVKVKVIW